MTEYRTGGCQCGAVRYEIEENGILTLYCCHCRECQRQAASGFGMSMIVRRSAFRLVEGSLAGWQRPTDRGTLSRAWFCPSCGVRIDHDHGGDSPEISVKAGSLDHTGDLSPVGHIWMKRAQPWVPIRPGLLVYDGQPDSLDALIAVYREG